MVAENVAGEQDVRRPRPNLRNAPRNRLRNRNLARNNVQEGFLLIFIVSKIFLVLITGKLR